MKDSLATGLLVLWVCVLLAARTQQQQLPECPLITAEELGSTTVASRVGFISSFFRIGESGIPLVQLFNFHIVCFHSGTTRNMYRGLSVVANYSCSDGPCPPVSTNGNIFQTQFDIECTTNPTAPADPPVWLQTPLGPPADQTPPDANFSTASRTDCGLCINPRADNAPANVDPITHCSSCDSSCTGQLLCFGKMSSDCCNFFDLDDQCVIQCPSGQFPNENNECSVAVGFITNTFVFSEGDVVGMVALVSTVVVSLPGGPPEIEITGSSIDVGGAVRPSGVAINVTEMLGTFIPVGIPIQQDDIALEDDELYGLSIRSLHPRIIAGGGGFFAAANATIIDDDVVLVGFSVENVTFSEDAGTVSVSVSRLQVVAQPFSLEVTSSPSGGEFVAPSAPEISTTLTFGSGTVVPFIGLMFDITDDLVAVESPENFTITLSTSDPRVLIGGSHIILDGVDIEVFTVFRELSVIITDNEAAMYGFDRVGYGVTEGNDVMVQVVGTHVTAQPLSFAIATIPGTADTADFEEGPFLSLCPQNTSECLVVRIGTAADLLVEVSETFDLSLTLVAPEIESGLLVSPAVATVTIEDATVDCGSLPPPANGDITLSGTVLGSTATYTCNAGFNLQGSSTRVCQESGWSGAEPLCIPVDCGTLPAPANGAIDLSGGTTFGSTATYSCNAGFNLQGSNTRDCQANGVWSGAEPVCVPVDCGTLPAPANGAIDLSGGTTFGSTATYSCNAGFNLQGSNTRDCQANGIWSGAEPVCVLEDCGTLPAPADGAIDLSGGTTFGSTATYSCNAGFNLQGSNTRDCQANGVWSGAEPVCVPVDCGTLPAPANGAIDLSGGTTFGSTATYSCNAGFNLQGSNTRDCQANGVWSGAEPVCVPVDCGTLPAPANGAIDLSGGTTFGSTATYSCNAGFNLQGSNTRDCQANGVWSGAEPVCVPVDCGTLPAPANGAIDLSGGTTFGSTATYSCNAGFNLQGSNTRDCQANGVWSGAEPVCVPVDCGTLPAPANGAIDLSGGTTFGSTATYSCNAGFNLQGSNTRVCQADGAWSGVAPRCVLAGDVAQCVVSSPSIIQTFASQATYSFNQRCEHLLVTSCLPPGGSLTNFSIRLDLLDGQISTGRIGIQYNNVRAVISESGTVDVSGDSSQYEFDPTSTGGTFTLLEIPVSVLFTIQSGSLAEVTVSVANIAGTLPGTCGLCGNATGHPVFRDQTVVDVTDADQTQQFFYEYFVRPGETILRSIERPECGLLRNDTVIGDPLYTVPLFDNRERHLCYEIHGDAGQHFNLISDECLSVNGLYAQRTVTVDSVPENLNVLSEIGVRAVDRSGNCVNVSVRVDGCATSVNGQPMIRYNQFGVRVRRSDSQVRVSVPNCEDANVVMRVFCDSVDGVSMIRFVVTRGLNLRETAHGFIGQFWNIPISVERFTGPVRDGSTNVYSITVTPPSGNQRSFPAWLEDRTWDNRRIPCFYAGSNQAGKVYEVRNPNGTVIEGNYRQYRVSGSFDTEFEFSHFDTSRCG